MQATDGDKFRNVIRGMSRMYGAEADNLVLDAYWISLSDWSFDDFQSAAARLMKTNKFMPRPSDFEDLRKAGRDTPAEAWLKARRFVRWSVSGHTLDPACPAILARCLAAVGGPNAVAMCDEDKLHFLERRFCEHFETMRESEDVREALPQIASDPERLRLGGGGLKRIGAA